MIWKRAPSLVVLRRILNIGLAFNKFLVEVVTPHLFIHIFGLLQEVIAYQTQYGLEIAQPLGVLQLYHALWSKMLPYIIDMRMFQGL